MILNNNPMRKINIFITVNIVLMFLHQVSFSQLANDYYDNGLKKYNNENYTDAIQDFQKALDLVTKSDVSYNQIYLDSYNRIGLCYYELHKYETALKYLDKVIGLDSTFAGFYFNRALVYGEMENNIGAIDDYTNAIKLKPDFAFAYANRGIIYLNLGHREEACQDFKKALDLGDNEIKSHYKKYCN